MNAFNPVKIVRVPAFTLNPAGILLYFRHFPGIQWGPNLNPYKKVRVRFHHRRLYYRQFGRHFQGFAHLWAKALF